VLTVVVLGVPGGVLGVVAGRAARRRPPHPDEAIPIAIGLASLVGTTMLALSALAARGDALALGIAIMGGALAALANGAAAAAAFLVALRR
jgi:hypothetical protein